MGRAMEAARKKLLNESILKAVASNDFETLEEDKHNAEIKAKAFDPTPSMGCSWSQFIMIMALLFSNQCSRIPSIVFGAGHDIPLPFFPTSQESLSYMKRAGSTAGGGGRPLSPPNANGGMISTNSGGNASPTNNNNNNLLSPMAAMLSSYQLVPSPAKDDYSVSSGSSHNHGGHGHHGHHHGRSNNLSKTAPGALGFNLGSTLHLPRNHYLHRQLRALQQSTSPSRPRTTSVGSPNNEISLREKYRNPERDFNSNFCEYRLDTILKKQTLDLPYPKVLRADFNKSMVELPRAGVFSASNKIGRNSNKLGETGKSMNESLSLPSLTSSIEAEVAAMQYGQPLPLTSRRTPRSPNGDNAGTARAVSSKLLSTSLRLGSASAKGNINSLNQNSTSMDSFGSFNLDAPLMTPGPTTGMSKMTSLSTAKSAHLYDSDSGGSEDEYDDRRVGTATTNKSESADLGFYKVCALCEQRHPRKAMEISVLWKHVINLRYYYAWEYYIMVMMPDHKTQI
jgi:hypothetical protein